MQIKDKIDFSIGYGLSSVYLDDNINKRHYYETFQGSRFGFIHRYFQKKAEKRIMKKAMKDISNQMLERHQKMAKLKNLILKQL